MQEISDVTVPVALARTGHPFLRHQIAPDDVRRAWLLGDAVVLDGVRGRPGEAPEGSVYTCLGPAGQLEPLMAHVVGVGDQPARVRVEVPARVPGAWHLTDPHQWHWMTTTTPVAGRETHPVERLDAAADGAAVDALLDVANADSFARPGAPGIALWLGVRRAGRLLATGALQRMHDGTLQLRGIAVHPDARGAGLGTALSAALTNHALRDGTGLASLGVYSDNATAVRLYERLGYRVVTTFSSGAVAP
ncbi:GNAT family N-acetyltransferase [Nocardioides mesophilus]|uniref:GNAT family N-acetyltransferase n=1 Tax=Nocardioides mesophilus TaxID=433659 RepID=A0A7G9R783_9ACTN|nr:GNAT family N-acetyltransferase [Nocardioides mesophilus]QNN51458.1 GNAT family N-acetyltransferase [Nocardioides mesophilus]